MTGKIGFILATLAVCASLSACSNDLKYIKLDEKSDDAWVEIRKLKTSGAGQHSIVPVDKTSRSIPLPRKDR